MELISPMLGTAAKVLRLSLYLTLALVLISVVLGTPAKA